MFTIWSVILDSADTLFAWGKLIVQDGKFWKLDHDIRYFVVIFLLQGGKSLSPSRLEISVTG